MICLFYHSQLLSRYLFKKYLMCIALYYINPTGKFRFILLFNREEYSKRPTDQLKIILNNGNDIIVAGQDKL